MIWKTKNRLFNLRSHAVVMGILNVTDDSFSDGGMFSSVDAAVDHALAMESAGAEIIDIGGESTRPGSLPVPVELELRRVLPVVEKLAGRLKAAISIDTSKAAVARACIERGAEIINDVTAMRGDPAMPQIAAETGAGVVLMHMKGTPRDMQLAPHYSNVVAEVRDFFRQTWQDTLRSGVDPMSIAFDPGIGFGKTAAHNLALLRELQELRIEDRPLVLGVSRKSFISKALGISNSEDRLWGTVALTSLGREYGARVFRVHDVKPNLEALQMTEAILGA